MDMVALSHAVTFVPLATPVTNSEYTAILFTNHVKLTLKEKGSESVTTVLALMSIL